MVRGVQKPNVLVLANMGLTGVFGSYAALHFIRGSGQGAHCAAGQAGHALGSGHLTIGHRGRGHGGHSPILHGLEHVLMQGGHWGTLDLRTYLDMSGNGGHSVFSIYLLISGMGGQGGTVAFKTHLLGSGSAHGGHADLPFPQRAQGSYDSNPSVRLRPTK